MQNTTINTMATTGADGGDQMADTLREKGQQKVYLQMIVMADRNGNPQKDTVNHQVDGKLFAPGLCMAEAITHECIGTP